MQRDKVQTAVVTQLKAHVAPPNQLLTSTTPVWVGPIGRDLLRRDPLPLAVHAVQCPYREAMIAALKAAGRHVRMVLESHSNQAVKACVEAGLAISLIDRSKVTERMQILDGMPLVADHDIVFMRSAASAGDEAVTLLAEAMQQRFRL